jgi:hypothetical protein
MAAGTVYQPNHYGMLMAVLGALALGMAFTEKKQVWKCAWGGIFAFSLIALLFSRSRAGTMVLLALALFVLATKLPRLRKIQLSFRKTALFAAAAAALTLVFSLLGFTDAAMLFLQRSAQLSTAMSTDNDITDISLADNVITVATQSGATRIGKLSASSWYTVHSDNGSGGARSLVRFAEKKGGWRTASVPGASGAVLRINRRGNAVLTGQNARLEFFAPGAEILAVDESKTNLRLLAEIPVSPYRPNGYEGILSARGYIWERSLEKWRERPLFGWGAGSLAHVFPNRELLNKQRYSFGEDEDKGHSILVTFLVQTGLIGTILYFLPFGYALRVLAAGRAALRFPLLLAMAAYIACGLTNDSTTGVTPLFCVFAGLAIAEQRAGQTG